MFVNLQIIFKKFKHHSVFGIYNYVANYQNIMQI
jgi:hypothetical protein